MRRNNVVYHIKESERGFTFYGRIVRIIGDKALWINVKGEIYLTLLSGLEVVDYTGRWDTDYNRTTWLPMPTLRKLKQRASNRNGYWNIEEKRWYSCRDAWNTPLDSEHFYEKD